MVIIMNYKKYSYYYDTIIYLIAGYKPFQEKVSRTCPTIWADGTTCSPMEDTLNKAFLELEMLDYLDLI